MTQWILFTIMMRALWIELTFTMKLIKKVLAKKIAAKFVFQLFFSDWANWDRLRISDQFKSSTNTVHDNGESSGTESTDSLIEEARDYLNVARAKLVTIDDWDRIDGDKIKRRKIKKKCKTSPRPSKDTLGKNLET